jgi:predicted dehydrogenase
MNKQKQPRTASKTISRREFLGGGAAAIAAFTIVPRHVLGGTNHTPPSEKLNVAGIGVGGMGKSNIDQISRREVGNVEGKEVVSFAGENIVALCDVDEDYAAPTFKEYPNAKRYRDYRIMLEKQKDIDAVVIATPDHTHAVIAMAAMQMGKHVYCQKPMTYSVQEARMLTEAARKYKVATQMGNQGHSGDGVRLLCEWIQDGAIGPVQEVHAWTNRPVWPQGIDRPKDTPPVPPTLDWDLWLGPAPYRPFHPIYLPFSWRGWWDFGTGALGDMACHILDPVFWSLKLKYPVSVEASVVATRSAKEGDRWTEEVVNSETYPRASIVSYRFPARGDMPAVKVTWHDGGLLPEQPDGLEPGRRLQKLGSEDSGSIFVGEKGTLVCGCYGESPRLIPEERMKEYQKPPETLPRIPNGSDGHEQDWVRACKTGEPACSNFDYSGPLTEMVVMGNLAIRFPGQRLDWDGDNMKCTNLPQANEYVRRKYRDGWSL